MRENRKCQDGRRCSGKGSVWGYVEAHDVYVCITCYSAGRHSAIANRDMRERKGIIPASYVGEWSERRLAAREISVK